MDIRNFFGRKPEAQTPASNNNSAKPQNNKNAKKSPASSKSKTSKPRSRSSSGKGPKSKEERKAENKQTLTSPEPIILDESEDEGTKNNVTSTRQNRSKLKSSNAHAVSSDSEDEVVLQRSAKRHKKVVRSDSESDDASVKIVSGKKAKKHNLSDSDEDVSSNIRDSFAKASLSKGVAAEQPQPVNKTKKQPLAVAAEDFFGASSVQRVDKKRKLPTPKKMEKSKEEPVTIDEHFSDDDFNETLRQLDSIEEHQHKKPRLDNSRSPKVKVEGEISVKVSPLKTPVKLDSRKVLVPDTPVTPETSRKTSPKKASPAKGISPPKPLEATPSSVQKKGNNYRSYMAREGPRALGSKEIPEGAPNCLEGLTFVITGVLESMERDETKSLVERHGGKVTGTVSKRTSYLIAGRDAGESKLTKAVELGTKKLDEDGLLDLIRKLPGKRSKYDLEAEKAVAKEKEEERKREKDKQRQTAVAKEQPSEKRKTTSPPQHQQPAKMLSLDALSGQKKTADEMLWVDKYKPSNVKQIIGQQGDKSNARKLLNWLKNWHRNVDSGKKPMFNRFNDDGSGHRVALLSGPPGVGKTTTATLVCKEAGFSFVELNASDTRSKKSLQTEVAESLQNHTLQDFKGGARSAETGKKHCLVMDEVDGMAGNEDRGGIAELVQLVKSTKIPIICMCNDRNHQKMRTLANYCFDLRFQRPRLEQIKAAMMTVVYKENLKIPPPALNEMILASNQDIRQVLHNLSMLSASDQQISLDSIKKESQSVKKDIKIGPFDACRKVFTDDEETRKMSLIDKSELFFMDYQFASLFVQENYASVTPNKARGNVKKHLRLLSRAADSISAGDMLERKIRGKQKWSLLPTQAFFSSVIPGEEMRGSVGGMVGFPQALGKLSSRNKTDRILQELRTHMALNVSGDKNELNMYYLPHFRHSLSSPLIHEGQDGIPKVMEVMESYTLLREDVDNIMDASSWQGRQDPMSKIESKVKAAFTRAFNKSALLCPYSTATTVKKKKGRAATADELGDDVDGDEQQSEEEDDRVESDAMIKQSKPKAKGRGATKKQQPKGENGKETSTKGKGKGRGKTSAR